MHNESTIYAGNEKNAGKALIMLHGRGSSGEDILSLSDQFLISDYLIAAPNATNNSWYPNSFLAPLQKNEPWLSSALNLIDHLVAKILSKGISKENIYFLGFSQGACLTLEYICRRGEHWGGVAAFTGGLIGDKIHLENYHGDFKNTPIFLGSGNPDAHVPVERVHATGNILRSMHADLTEKIYNDMGHTIIQDEIDNVNKLIFKA